LNRIELNHVEPSIRTVAKIDRALRQAEKEESGKGTRKEPTPGSVLSKR
jgi:hypothetical protein